MSTTASIHRSFAGYRPLHWLFLCFLLAVPSLGRSSEPVQGSVSGGAFGDALEVRVIELDVVVARNGQPIHGLGSEDFVVEVDGRAVPIEYFARIERGHGDDGAAVGTSTVVFVDDYFALPTRRDPILKALATDLDSLRPTDQMAVVAYDGRQVEILAGWTSSVPVLREALAAAGRRPALGLRRLSEERRRASIGRIDQRPGSQASFSSIGFEGSGRGRLEGLSHLDSSADAVTFQVRGAASAAMAALRALPRPSGRRGMLLLSGGWPTVGEGATVGGLGGRYVQGLHGSDAFLAPLIDTANRLGYTLYPVDVAGVTRHLGRAEASTAREARDLDLLGAVEEGSAEDNLVRLARSTGGRAFLDAARKKAMPTVLSEGRSYYSLGISPEWKHDDRRRRLRVEVPSQRGVEVRARRSFIDHSPASEIALRVESARLLPGVDTVGRGLEVRLGPATSSGMGRVRVPIEIEIALDELVLVPRGDGYSADVEVRIAATTDDGSVSDLPIERFRLREEHLPEAGRTAFRSMELVLRRADQRLLVSLYDPASGTLFARNVKFSPETSR